VVFAIGYIMQEHLM